MSRQSRDSRPPPPQNFPTPNVPRSSAYSQPQGAVYPAQTSNYGTHPPQQSVAYATPQPHQLGPPPAQRTRDPYSATHAPASAYTYSSSPPHPSTHLPSSGPPQPPSSMPVPSVPGGYGTSTNFSGAPPPMMQRVATMPTPGQAHNPHSVPYHNVPAPVIAHQPSHSGTSGGTRSVTGDWSHDAQCYSHLEQRPQAAGNSSGYGREKGPPSRPGAGKPPVGPPPPPPDLPCRYCGRMTRRAVYDRWEGFCKEKHRNDWNAKHNPN